jgi:hypothetical protein
MDNLSALLPVTKLMDNLSALLPVTKLMDNLSALLPETKSRNTAMLAYAKRAHNGTITLLRLHLADELPCL